MDRPSAHTTEDTNIAFVWSIESTALRLYEVMSSVADCRVGERRCHVDSRSGQVTHQLICGWRLDSKAGDAVMDDFPDDVLCVKDPILFANVAERLLLI